MAWVQCIQKIKKLSSEKSNTIYNHPISNAILVQNMWFLKFPNQEEMKKAKKWLEETEVPMKDNLKNVLIPGKWVEEEVCFFFFSYFSLFYHCFYHLIPNI